MAKKEIKENERPIPAWVVYQALQDIDDITGAACALRDAMQNNPVPDYLRGAAASIITLLIHAQHDLAKAADIEI